MVKCLLKCQNSNPLDPGETLVSRFVHLESKTLKVNKGFDVVIPHSGPIHTKGYEVVVKEFCEETSTWRELDGDMFTNIQDVKGGILDCILALSELKWFHCLCTFSLQFSCAKSKSSLGCLLEVS